MTPEEFLQSAVSNIKSRKQRTLIKQEIANHIADRKEYYLDAGYSNTQAEERAIEHMGNPNDIAKSMAKMYNAEGWKRASLILSLIYGLSAIIGSLLTTFMIITQVIEEENNDTITYIFSLITFISGALSFACGFKAKDSFAIDINSYVNFGVIFFSPIVFIPFGYALTYRTVELTDFLISHERITRITEIFANPKTYLIGRGIISTSDLLFSIVVLSFVLFPVVTGIAGRRLSKIIETDITEKSEKRYKIYSLLLIVVAVLGIFPNIIIPVAEFAETKNEEKLAASVFESDCNKAWEVFESINLPLTKERAFSIAKLNGIDTLSTYDEYEITLYTNHNYSISVTLSDDNSRYDSICFTKTTENGDLSYKTINEIDNRIDDNIKPDELIELFGKEAIHEYEKYDNTIEIEINNEDYLVDYNYIFENERLSEIEDDSCED